MERIHKIPPLPARPKDAHKGTFGNALIIAGSQGMAGAACLAGQAALHGGAGLVTVAIPRSIATIVASAHCSYMTAPQDEDDQGRLVKSALGRLDEALLGKTAVAIGPGLGRSADVRHIVQQLYSKCPLPVVLDADGLNAFADNAEQLGDRHSHAARVLTPHPGEFSRLTGLATSAINANREQLAIDFAQTHDVVLLLKGPRTIITDGKRLAVNLTGDSSLATGGSGDVLTGLITSLLAQGMSALDAAQLGAHVHGLSAEFVSRIYTDRYATSSELLRHLADAWQQLAANDRA